MSKSDKYIRKLDMSVLAGHLSSNLPEVMHGVRTHITPRKQDMKGFPVLPSECDK